MPNNNFILPLLQIKNLSVSFKQENNIAPAVEDISFNAERGKMIAVVGESGSGKSVTALSILQLLPREAGLKGEILFSPDGITPVNLATLPPKEISKIRGNQIAMIFQEPMTSLNPVITCGAQVIETLRAHQHLSKKEAKNKTADLFAEVGLPDPAGMINRYPHQLSGGQKQRVMIAMAIGCRPDILIADEPTTALDVLIQKNILALLKSLQEQNNMTVLFITHDLGLVADIADELIVMYRGKIAEQGNAIQVLNNPQHDYTKALLACRPATASKGKRLATIDPAANNEKNRNHFPSLKTRNPEVTDEKIPVLSVENLKVYFPASKNIFRKSTSFFKAVDDVSFEVMKNETIGLVGQSGCGKTTLGKAILQLVNITSGRIILHGKNIATIPSRELREIRKDLQVVFQDPYGSLNPRISIGEAITEPLKVHNLNNNKRERKEKAAFLLEQVQLNAGHLNRYPHQFSGGQRQRICIARALATDPSFLIFDESVSALDVSIQAQVLNLINDLKASYNFTSIFISHDLAVIHYISDRILVMNQGKIIEQGTADDIYNNPKQDYTQRLIEAIPGKKLA